MREQLQEVRTFIGELISKLNSVRWEAERIETALIVKGETKLESLKYSAIEEEIIKSLPLLQHTTNCLIEMSKEVKTVKELAEAAEAL